MLVLLCWEHCLATVSHHPLHRHDNGLQYIRCGVMCSTAQLGSITLNSAANEPRFSIINERVNVLDTGPLLALASARMLSHFAPVCGPCSCRHQLQSILLISECVLQPRPLTQSMRTMVQHVQGRLLILFQSYSDAVRNCQGGLLCSLTVKRYSRECPGEAVFQSASTIDMLRQKWSRDDSYPNWQHQSMCISLSPHAH